MNVHIYEPQDHKYYYIHTHLIKTTIRNDTMYNFCSIHSCEILLSIIFEAYSIEKCTFVMYNTLTPKGPTKYAYINVL